MRIRLLALVVLLFKQPTGLTHEGNMVHEFKKVGKRDPNVTVHKWDTLTLPSTRTVLQSHTETNITCHISVLLLIRAPVTVPT